MSRTTMALAAVVIFAIGAAAGWLGSREFGAHGTTPALSDVPTIALYDNWRLACPGSAQKGQPCVLGQDLIESKSHQRIANLTLVRTKTGKILVVTVPYNVMLAAGVGIGFDKDKPRVYPFTTCEGRGCVAQIPVDEKILASLRDAAQGRILFEELNKQVVQILFSLNGFKRADDIARLSDSAS